MKNLKLLMMGFLFIGMTALVGCKKEDKITNNLWKKGGEWNIDKYQYSGSNYSYTEYNYGTFQFNKEGTGKMTFHEDGEIFSNLFTYTNTENSLTLTFKEGPMYSEGDRENYTLDWLKDKINLYSWTADSWGYEEYKIDLSKK